MKILKEKNMKDNQYQLKINEESFAFFFTNLGDKWLSFKSSRHYFYSEYELMKFESERECTRIWAKGPREW